MMREIDLSDEKGESSNELHKNEDKFEVAPNTGDGSPTKLLVNVSNGENGASAGGVEDLVEELNGLLQQQDGGGEKTVKHFTPENSGLISHTIPDELEHVDANCSSTNGVGNVLSGDNESSNVDKMAKFYDKFSLQCSEIEKLEKLVQQLQDQCASALRDKDAYANQIRDLNKNHNLKVLESDKRIADMDSQFKIAKDRSAAQETHFRKVLSEQETKFNAHIEQLKKTTELAQREKDSAVVKYAQREKEVLTLESNLRKHQQQASQLSTERDALSSRLRGAKNEKEHLVQIIQQKEADCTDWKRKYEDVKNFIQEAEVRVKLSDKRVGDVENAHKETKLELEKVVKKLKESKEENQTIKTNCQEMIKQLQEADDKKRVEVEIQKQEHTDQEEIYKKVLNELDALKKQHKSVLLEIESKSESLNSIQKNLTSKDSKISELEIIVDGKENEINRLQNEISENKKKIDAYESEKRRALELEAKVNEIMCENLDLENEAVACRKNAENMLDLTQKLSDKTSQLQSENSSLLSKLSDIERENQELKPLCENLKSQIASYEYELNTLKAGTSGEITDLHLKLTKAAEKEQELNTLLDDERNQCKILKKKHTSSLKELKNEVSLLKRRLESYESGTASQCSGGSAGDEPEPVCSRSPSMTSLDTTATYVNAPGVAGGALVAIRHHGVESPNDSHSTHSQHSAVTCEHNQAIIEKIVKLQRMLARRTEKIEFLEEHNKQMISELQKKSRIIQSYALREETGALTPESVDINKLLEYTDQAQMAKKGHTVMGSVFGSNDFLSTSSSSTLNSDLSVQIMRKLQAVLEDALLKNITLKESIETLGNEISKLSRENRTLNLKLQDVGKKF